MLNAAARAEPSVDLAALSLEERHVGALWRRALAACPERVFLKSDRGDRTYGAMGERVDRLAGGLAARGLGAGGKLGLMLGNSFEFAETWLASAVLGAVYVPINTDYRGAVLAHQLALADVTHLVIDAAYLPRLAAVRDKLPKLGCVIAVGSADDLGDAVRYEAALDAEPVAPPAGRHTDPHAISFTSGTTGLSKGVLASHCHVVSFALDWIEACRFGPEDRLHTCLPMFHAIATWLGLLPTIIQQTTASFAERFSARAFWDDVRRFDATAVHGIFAMVPILLKQPPRSDDADVPARVFYIGQRNPEFERRFNCRIVEVYGATETGIVTMTPYDEPGVPGSCGRPNLRTYDVDLLDEDDRPVPPDTVGEIVVRPHQPFSMIGEYYNMPRETLAAFRNLWFHTGDCARRDAAGQYFFVDRKKDAIRRRGENISSYELESVLTAEPRVLECAAVAVPSELGEDEVKLVIVPQPGAAIEPAEIWALCDENMPRFWVPRFLEFRDALPKTPNGKVQKYQLRAGSDGGVLHDRLARESGIG